jgi:hypothetical protein
MYPELTPSDLDLIIEQCRERIQDQWERIQAAWDRGEETQMTDPMTIAFDYSVTIDPEGDVWVNELLTFQRDPHWTKLFEVGSGRFHQIT